ncbi:PAS domain S-box protein [Methanospirillum sp. J.3.6.1-F.2.7.3]|uniref:PAS domain S-box protein n=1 Tax=Methanospirillum purgamenti TaxID=2834276 RepID=A0A8E7B3U7_9EURY|nr:MULTISPECIES: PAS domain S-box protein [Methanospirillum]MDX8549865.1 PAS domain S-box protein [Methanospirillum hungatei]QVV90002.1 PAS domain S-box protein [Methanospirillum sp. J.3.6.1-F.2.7.3]
MSIGSYEEQVHSLLCSNREGLTIEEVSRLLHITRTTAARYLESLFHAGRAERRSLGPAKIYRASFRVSSSEILAVLDEGVLIISHDGTITDVNPAFCEILFTSSDTLKGRSIRYSPLAGIFSEEIQKVLLEPPLQAIEGILHLSGQMREKFLRYRIFAIQLVGDERGSVMILQDQTEIQSSKEQAKSLASEYEHQISLIHSDLTNNLEKAKSTVREVSSRERAIRDLLQNVRAVILKVNSAGKVVFCNHYASEIVHLHDGEQDHPALLHTLFPHLDEQGIVITDKIDLVRNGISDFSSWDSSLIIENQISSQIYSWNLIRLRKGKNGASMILAGFDITDLITRERQVVQSQKRMEWILDHLPDPTFAVDKNKLIILWNKQLENMAGLQSEETIGKSIDLFVPAIYGYSRPVLADLIFNRYDPSINAFFKNIVQEGEALTAETIAYRQDGSKRIYWVKVTPYYTETGELSGAIQSLRDITSFRENEAKIRDEEELLRGIAEHVLDDIMVINRAGMILYANPSLGRLIGTSPENLIGVHISEAQEIRKIFPTCDRFKSVFLSGIPLHELFTITHDGVEMLMDAMFIPEKDNAGLISAILIVLRNVTSLRDEIYSLQHRITGFIES